VVRRTQVIVLLLALAAALPAVDASPLAAQTTFQEAPEPVRPHPEAEKAIRQLKSPYCPGLMLEVCTSSLGAMLRDSIQMLARDEGWTSEQIVDWVLENHGDTLLATPRASGIGLVAWAVPFAAVVAGVGLLVFVLVHLRRRAAARATAPPAEDLSEDDEERLKEALEVLEESEEPVF